MIKFIGYYFLILIGLIILSALTGTILQALISSPNIPLIVILIIVSSIIFLITSIIGIIIFKLIKGNKNVNTVQSNIEKIEKVA
jgi:hypothetical protein